MIVLAGLVFVLPRAVLLTGVLILLGHNLFDPVREFGPALDHAS